MLLRGVGCMCVFVEASTLTSALAELRRYRVADGEKRSVGNVAEDYMTVCSEDETSRELVN